MPLDAQKKTSKKISPDTPITGTFTAIITPFTQDGSIDEKTLRKLVDFQIASGITGIVPCGTTGESPTLSHEEHDRVIEIVIDQAKGRCLVIGGAGSNSTAEAIRLTKHAKEAGCDAVLSVNPYYNKPTQEGLYRHFKAINDAVDIPIILYNIKGRTGVNIETPTLLRLTKLKNIIGVKEASGDLEQIREVIRSAPKGFTVLHEENLTLSYKYDIPSKFIYSVNDDAMEALLKMNRRKMNGKFSRLRN